MTNSGSAASTSVTVEPTWSTGRSRFIAIHTPRPIDSGTATAEATSTRKAELATRVDSSSLTGCWVAMDSPKLPLSTPPIHSRYWLTTDWSRFSCSRRAATLSGVASLPRMAVAASPGSASTAANTTSEMSHRVSTPSAIRRMISFLIAASAPFS
jgi:hypothetical protein